MKHYTSTIPLPLAEKLKEKGMPMEDAYTPILYDKPESVMSGCIIPIYAEVFDWLMEREITILVRQCRTDFLVGVYSSTKSNYFRKDTWHEAAEKAIEKALTLI